MSDALKRITGTLSNPPWALVIEADRPGLTIALEDGSVVERAKADDVARLADHAIYALPRHRDIVRALDGRCVGNVWRRGQRGSRVSSLNVESATAYMIPLFRGFAPDPDLVAKEFGVFARWVRAQDVGMASLGTIAENLLRRTLPYDVDLKPIDWAHEAVYSGRKRPVVPGVELHGAAYYDKQATYPIAQVEVGMPTRPPRWLRGERDLPRLRDTVLRGRDGAAVCQIVVPEALWGPIPFRTARGLVWGWSDTPRGGTWTFDDLRSVHEVGGEIVGLDYAFEIHTRDPDFYRSWWKLVEEGRALEGFAGQLVKACTSKTWAAFSMSGRTASRTWDSGGRQVGSDVLGHPGKGRAPQLSALVDGRVRRQIWQALRDRTDIPYTDTDGVWAPKGECPSGFREKAQGTVQIAGPQAYRWRESEDGPWVASVAGMDPVRAMALFEDGTWRRSFPVAINDHYLGDDLHVPTVKAKIRKTSR